MKRLIVSAVLVSVFFIGISGIIESASAKFRTDEKAMKLIKAARTAIGGTENLAQVRSMTIRGSTTHFFEKEGVQDVKQGSLEINFELPGKFTKRVKIGAPGAEISDEIIDEDIDIVVDKDNVEFPVNVEGKDNVFVIRKGDGKDVEWVTEGDGHVQVKDGKVFITKEDGTVEELKSDANHKILVKTEDGNIARVEANENTWTSDDNKRIEIKREHAFGPHGRSGGEMLRTTMALLMHVPDDGNVTYKFAGEGNVDGFASNIVEVGSHGSSFKLYLDAGTNLPQMISYQEHGHHVVHFDGKKRVIQERYVGMEKSKKRVAHEKQIRFSDFREVGGLMLPHRWTETRDGKSVQNIDITGYEINPANIAERLGKDGNGGKMIIKKRMKKN